MKWWNYWQERISGNIGARAASVEKLNFKLELEWPGAGAVAGTGGGIGRLSSRLRPSLALEFLVFGKPRWAFSTWELHQGFLALSAGRMIQI